MTDQEFIAHLARVQRTMTALARAITGNDADGQDALQEAALAAYVARGQLRSPERFAPWFRTILIHKCGETLRRRRQVIPLDAACQRKQEATAESGLIWMLVDQLSPEVAQVVVLRYLADLPQRDIADVLGIPVGTVKSRLNRALKQLRTMLEEVPAKCYAK